MRAQSIAVGLLVALILAGPLQPLVLAQQTEQPADTGQDPARPEQTTVHRTDVYDVGAEAITVIGMPLKAGVCALSGVVGFALLVLTLGSAHRATAAVVEEGCGQKWIVRGDDIRPDQYSSRAYEWESQRGGMSSR
jgi:hypothetical protein